MRRGMITKDLILTKHLNRIGGKILRDHGRPGIWVIELRRLLLLSRMPAQDRGDFFPGGRKARYTGEKFP
jgi:hypothetical protein